MEYISIYIMGYIKGYYLILNHFLIYFFKFEFDLFFLISLQRDKNVKKIEKNIEYITNNIYIIYNRHIIYYILFCKIF